MTDVIAKRAVIAGRARHPNWATRAGVAGILIHVTVGAVASLLLPGLVVTYPALYAFYAGWALVLILSVVSLPEHPWRSLVLPVAGITVSVAVRIVGEQAFGWRG